MGNLVGSMLPADVHARFKRATGNEVLFICATDEHGTPAELSAAAAKQTVADYCNDQHQIQKNIYSAFNLSFDWFGRSSSDENKNLTQEFAWYLEQQGWIEEKTTHGLYCLDDQRFLPDRYALGTCPYCSFARARGDQCDGCGKLLDPLQLKNPVSSISGSNRMQTRLTTHLYLKQSGLAGKIEEWLATKDWGKTARGIAQGWLREGIEDRAITRDLEWGVPVAHNGVVKPGFENKRFYVWFDAPIEYIAATQEWSKSTDQDWQRWWRLDQGAEEVEYLQFMGKDNVAFHAVSFPATILGSAQPWKTVDRIKAFDWLTWYGGKFSTSQGIGIFMDAALDILPADIWRWTLMAHAPENSDVAFTLNLLASTTNADLANNFGNFLSRTVKLASLHFEGKVPDPIALGAREEELFAQLQTSLIEITRAHESLEFRRALEETRAVFSAANNYITDCEPWKTIKTDKEETQRCIYTCLGLISFISKLIQPIVPEIARKAQSIFECKTDFSWPTNAKQSILSLEKGVVINTIPVLVERITEDNIQDWSQRFQSVESNKSSFNP